MNESVQNNSTNNSQNTITSLESTEYIKPYDGVDTNNHENFLADSEKNLPEDNNVIPPNGNELSRYESNVELSRNLSRRMTGTEQLMQEASASKEPLPLMGENRAYPPMLPDRTPYAVAFDGIDDPKHPHNYSLQKKLIFTFVSALSALSVSLGSAMFSQGSLELMEQYHIGITPAALGTSLYVLGFATGPVIYGPLSELFGRKMMMVVSSLGYVSFSFATAVSKDIQSIMICRFFTGFVGSASFVILPAILLDLYSTKHRGIAIAVFSMCLFGGPMLAPILGGFTVKNSLLGWRWTAYFCGIVGSLSLVLNIFVLEETHHPVILIRKAEILRRRTGNWGIYAPHEELSLDLKEIVQKNIARPIKLLFTEPIILFVLIYNAFIYAMLYMFLTAVPLIFSTRYMWSEGVAELPYLSMLIGLWTGGFVIIIFEKRYLRAMELNNGRPVPEERLPPIMIGAFTFVIGIFWMGWSGDYPKQVHWIVPTIGAAFIGNGLILIFLPTMNYIIDCYLYVAASALAGNTFLRSAMAAVFPLFSHQMFVNLLIKWASTLVGCLAALMIPMPFIFYKYGKSLRERSDYAFK